MGKQAIRWLAATLNFLVSGTLTAAWCQMLLGYLPTGRVRDPFDYIGIAILVAVTVASAGAAILLARPQTAPTGRHWHHIVSCCWLAVVALSPIVYLVEDHEISPRNWQGLGVVGCATALWLLIGVLLRASPKRTVVSASSVTNNPLESAHETAPSIAAFSTTPAPTTSVTVPEINPLSAARRP